MKQKTVVITGASSGIGMEFARAFSKMGCRLILTARRKERLEKLREELGTPCKIIVADLSREGECYQFFENIADEPVDVFINNAGFGTCGKFDETDLGKEVSMINVNIKAMHILFKKMIIKMKKQGYGRILNVASSLYGNILCYKILCSKHYKGCCRRIKRAGKQYLCWGTLPGTG